MNKIVELAIKYLNENDISKALDTINEDEVNTGDVMYDSNFILARGILWELVENYPKAQEHYENSLKINPNNLIAMQYYAQILSKKGEYPKSREIFEKWFQLRSEGTTAI